MEKSDLKIICLTPVLNEEWIIEKFLQAASIWADVIILSDNGSTDNTIKIASNFPKVRIIDNSEMKDYNEGEMRKPLYDEARKIPGKKLLVSLDADEFFTPNFDDLEWETILKAPLGTRFIFNWINIQPNLISYFILNDKPLAIMDDDSPYEGGVLHQFPIPMAKNKPSIKLNNIKVLHFQYVNWERLELKQMWYRMYEKVINPKKNSISIWRQIHYQKNRPIDNIKVYALQPEWLNAYNKYGLELTSYKISPINPWDKKIISYIEKYGWKRFKYVDINISYIRSIDYQNRLKSLKIKHNFFDLGIMYYLKKTQIHKSRIRIKLIDYFLMKIIK